MSKYLKEFEDWQILHQASRFIETGGDLNQADRNELAKTIRKIAHDMPAGTVTKSGIQLDELQHEVSMLDALLKDRHPGLSTWNTALRDRLKRVHSIIAACRLELEGQ